MVQNADDVWARIVALAEDTSTFGFRQLGKQRILTRQTDLVADLGLIGDDASEFMDKYAEIFNIDAGDYDFATYFDPEQLWILPRFGKAKKKNSITLGMLELAAKRGAWDVALLEQARGENNYEFGKST